MPSQALWLEPRSALIAPAGLAYFSMHNSPILSLVTGKVERDISFRRLVDSILRNTVVDFELIVSDASDIAYVPESKFIKVIHEKPRKTHSHGYNAAFRACSGKFAIWLNDDAEVCPGYDTESIVFMEAHPRIGLGALHYSENGGPFHVNEAYGCIYGNFGIVRKELGDSVGWFDPDLRMYGCDNSLAFRILLADYGIADISKAKILHHSVNDPIRSQNQIGRPRDNQILTDRYMPQRTEWLAAFRRHYVNTGTVPWVHGREPSKVTA